MFKVLLLTLALTALASAQEGQLVQISQFVGTNPTPFFPTQSREFQKLLLYVYALNPPLDGWLPSRVTRQPVELNAVVWDMTLVSPENDRQATVLVYYHTVDNFARILRAQVLDEPSAVPSPVDGWIVDENAMGPDFVLDQVDAAWQFPQCPKRNELNQAELITAQAYNFSFIRDDQEQSIVVNVPSVPEEIAPTVTLSQYFPLRGAELTGPQLMLFSLEMDLVGQYEILEAYRRIDNQGYLMVVYNPESRFQHDQLIYKVCFDTEGSPTVSLVQQLRLDNYTPAHIGVSVYASYQLYPQLQGYVLATVSNIWHGEGLKMVFGKEDGHVLINYVYMHDEKIYSRLFSEPL